jgi:hypothetical protein
MIREKKESQSVINQPDGFSFLEEEVEAAADESELERFTEDEDDEPVQ